MYYIAFKKNQTNSELCDAKYIIKMLIIILFSILSILLQYTEGNDVFRFANHYSNHMVLQRAPYSAVLWGFGEEGAMVHVKIADKKYITTVKKGFYFS